MQLHACLLLFIVTTTGKTLALPDHHCGGNLSLDQEPAGSLSLASPGRHHQDRNLWLCAWLLDVPVGRTTVLRLEQLDGGSNVSVRCVGPDGDHERVLENGREAPLSGCEGNKATLTWTGAGPSSVQLSYHVQEDERNSSGGRATHQPGRELVTRPQAGTSFTRTAPVSQGVVSGENGGGGHLNESSEGSLGPWTVSGLSAQDQGPPHPTTPLQGLALAGGADGETLPLPEEAANNGADTSGTARPADSPVSAREGTRTYFHTRHSTSNTEPNSSARLVPTQTALMDAAASGSSTTMAAEIHKHAYGHEATRAQPQLPSQTTGGGGASPITSGGAVGEEKQPPSRRNTNTFASELTSSVTSDPMTPPTKPRLDDSGSSHAETEADSSASRGPSSARPSTAHIAGLHASAGTATATAASYQPNASVADSYESTTSDVATQTAAVETSDEFVGVMELRSPTSSPSLQSTEGFTRSAYTSATFAETSAATQTATQTATQGYSFNASVPTNASSSSPDVSTGDGEATSFTGSPSASGAALTLGDVFHPSSDTVTAAGPHRLRPTHAPFPSTSLQTSLPPLQSSTSMYSSAPSHTLHTHTADLSHTTHTPLPLTSFTTVLGEHTPLQTSTTESSPSHTLNHLNPSSSSSPKQSDAYVTTTRAPFHAHTTAKSDLVGNTNQELEKDDDSRRLFPTTTSTNTPTAGPAPAPRSTPHRSNVTATSSSVTTTPPWSSTSSRPPKYYIVPDQPAAVKVETIELLLQIILEESGSADAVGLEEDTAVWLRPYLQNAPGFSRLLGVWSSGHAVQNLVEFKTSGALQWLGATGPTSLLERTGLAQAVREARGFRSSRIVNVTLGGQQGEVCDWLLRCPAGYQCVSQPGTANYSCSSLCHVDYCHHHGICTHHPDELPVCRCLVGDDFWYMGQRCDVRMTRARLVGTYLAILLIIVTVIGVLALVAVRRYRAILIQAKVDQTRSSYRRFNHFDELSGRFWLRSWAGSADSLDNPAFTRSDELLHLRALDRPCCYHDDTLSLASTSPSHGARINTIYPHSSQYAWRGSEMSVGDGVLDSGKASDLSVCSWPVEPIQWTPFPLLQQLASHRTPTVRVSRPRSYCEGMELVDLEKSWTA